MEIEFEFSFEPVLEQELVVFESKYNLILPSDYKRFIKKYNGGKSVLRRFQTLDEVVTSSIMLFFPFDVREEHNIEGFYQKYNLTNIIPSNFLPIGRDPMNNIICLAVSGEDIGRVYYCDLTHLDEDKGLIKELVRLTALSFTEFIQSLYKTE
ncbi:SMI1/KNR4 family protein [Paenibacillus sp. FSL R7-0337]|uniref:SMI1/KNR4 family protein n=1 Tax=unclassified Paenibacillus TaxID=185978 RepID=UPI00096E8E19|nr:SMI1/KNR4 family protein [Paenibacillus sp. FSL R7-0337]OMF84179.1 SMI1/KNR4 family protein [Paenibacillus sp. FSL R7-0337]